MPTDDPDLPDGPIGTENLRDFLTFRISRVNARLSAQASRILNTHGNLSQVQWRMLASIHAFGVTTSHQICRATAMDKGLVSRKLKQLIKDGLVRSETNEVDNRQHMLTLTQKGKDAYARVQPIMKRRREFLTAQLTEQEASVLAQALMKLDASADRVDFET